MPLKEPNQILTYRLTVTTQKQKNNKCVEEVWERIFKICYIGSYKGNHRFQILTLNLNYSSSLPMPYVYFQKRMASVFDIISISVNPKGEIVSINNLNTIITKADKIIEELSIDHRGGYFDMYTKDFKESISDSVELIDFLLQYNMFGLLFQKEVWGRNALIPFSGDDTPETLNDEWEVVEMDVFDESVEINNEQEQLSIISSKGKAYFKRNRLYEVNIEQTEELLITKYNLLWIG